MRGLMVSVPRWLLPFLPLAAPVPGGQLLVRLRPTHRAGTSATGLSEARAPLGGRRSGHAHLAGDRWVQRRGLRSHRRGRPLRSRTAQSHLLGSPPRSHLRGPSPPLPCLSGGDKDRLLPHRSSHRPRHPSPPRGSGPASAPYPSSRSPSHPFVSVRYLVPLRPRRPRSLTRPVPRHTLLPSASGALKFLSLIAGAPPPHWNFPIP